MSSGLFSTKWNKPVDFRGWFHFLLEYFYGWFWSNSVSTCTSEKLGWSSMMGHIPHILNENSAFDGFSAITWAFVGPYFQMHFRETMFKLDDISAFWLVNGFPHNNLRIRRPMLISRCSYGKGDSDQVWLWTDSAHDVAHEIVPIGQ